MSKTIEFDDKKLKQLIKAFKGKAPVARVGILGKKSARTDDELNNASIGAAHEFGTEKLPVRSFLRMPLTEKINGELQKAGAFKQDTLKKVIAEGSLRAWVAAVGVIGEKIVKEAFATGGFGRWKPTVNMAKKKVQMTLVESTQLRESISSEVV